MYKLYAQLYHSYTSALFKSLRLLTVFFLTTLIFVDLGTQRFPKFSLFLLFLFLLFEIYIQFRIARIRPAKTVSQEANNFLDYVTRPVLYSAIRFDTTDNIMRELLHLPQVVFLLHKAGVSTQEIKIIPVDKNALFTKARELTRKIGGVHITSMDLFTAYLLTIEDQTKLLFSKELKDEDLEEILLWARMDFPYEESPQKTRIHFFGEGFGESLLTGWTLETKKYTRIFPSDRLSLRPVITGREAEYKQMQEGLQKKENNNIMLVGETGVGKESLVRAFAYDSLDGAMNQYISHKKILEILVGSLIAGAGNKGDLEMRLQAIIDEVSHAGNVILYVPNFENILGASSFNINLSGVLLPYLNNGKIPIIATITKGNYKVYLENNPLTEVFRVIEIEEPTAKHALFMLFEKTHEIEEKHACIITYQAVKTAVTYSDRYVVDGVLPGSAIVLLEEAANGVVLKKQQAFENTKRVLVTKDDIIKKVEEKIHVAIASPKDEEKQLLLNLEQKMHERIVAQDEAVHVISDALRRIRSGVDVRNKPISFLFLGPTGVGKTETAKTLASLYFGGQGNIVRLDMSEYADETGLRRLLGAPPGEGEERGELTEKVHDHPYSLILLDEFEKAHPKILNLFLQVLDDGRLTDNKGRTVSFINTIIIATSNAGSELIREEVKKGTKIDQAFEQILLNYLQTTTIFRPELLNRFDDIVTFRPLSQEQIIAVSKLFLTELIQEMKEQDIEVSFDGAVVAKIAESGSNTEFGARPLRRFLQDTVEDLLAKKKLTGEIKRGSRVMFSLNATGEIILSVT